MKTTSTVPFTSAIVQLSTSKKIESIAEKEFAFMAEFGERPTYSILPSGREFSVEIINGKYPAKEYGDCTFDAKISALNKALKDMQDV